MHDNNPKNNGKHKFVRHKISHLQVGVFHVGSLEGDPPNVGSLVVGIDQIGLWESAALKIGSGKVCVSGQYLRKIFSLVVPLGKVLVGNVEAGKIQTSTTDGKGSLNKSRRGQKEGCRRGC